MRPSGILCTAALLAATSNGWPWPPSAWQPAGDVAKRQIGPLVARQDSTTSNTDATSGSTQQSSSPTPTSGSATNSDASSTPASNSDVSSTGSSSGSATGSSTITGSAKSSASASGSGSKSASKSASKTHYSDNLPPGGISMITPNAFSTSYYKIGQPVTFAWNYTSLSATPTAVDVLAVASVNSMTYTIATNQSIPNATQTVVWDTGAYESSAGTTLVMATYTLVVYDAESSVSATAAPGYLGTSDQFTFGMYAPQQYDQSQQVTFRCITCSDATALIRYTIGFTVGMAVMTVLSFTWFGNVAGLI